MDYEPVAYHDHVIRKPILLLCPHTYAEKFPGESEHWMVYHYDAPGWYDEVASHSVGETFKMSNSVGWGREMTRIALEDLS